MNNRNEIHRFLFEYLKDICEIPLIVIANDYKIVWCNNTANDMGIYEGEFASVYFGNQNTIERACRKESSTVRFQPTNQHTISHPFAKLPFTCYPIYSDEQFEGAVIFPENKEMFTRLGTESITQIFSNLHLGLIITDSNLDITFLNPSARTLLDKIGIESDNWGEIIRQMKQSQDFVDKMVESIKSGEVFSFRINFTEITPTKYYEFTILTYRNYRTEQEKIVITIQDITEHLKISEHKKQILKQEFLERFSSNVFHKLNNQFLLIMADAGLMRKKIQLDSTRNIIEHLDTLEEHIMEASEIVQLLSLFVRAPTQQFEDINILKFLEKYLSNRASLLPKSVELSVKLPDINIITNSYPSLLERIFESVLDNAVQSLPKTGGKIMVSAEIFHPDRIFLKNYPELSSVPYLKISIADTGIGIEQKYFSRVFEPFFSNWKEPSQGLGLSIAMSAIRHHGGTIQIQSAKNVGTTVSLFFPVELVETQPQKLVTSDTDEKIVLLIDDDSDVRNAIAQMLETLGYIPITASSAGEGIELFGKARPDIVLLDMIMPDMGGETVYKKIMEIDPKCPIIISTAYAQIEAVEELLDAGVQYILQKPFTVNKLDAVLKKVLND
ncbi:hypothetical protein DRQ33_00740 [bacterium]|nr:MAG: hypothetical protein DRQ33_00740 [bacterium]